MSKPSPSPELTPGDYVFYPGHGVGQYLATETRQIAGMNLYVRIVFIEREKAQLQVPVGKARQDNLLPLATFASANKIKAALKELIGDKRESNKRWKYREDEFTKRLLSADLAKIVSVIRDLNPEADDQKQISASALRLIRTAAEYLIDTLRVVWETDEADVLEELDRLLEEADRKPLSHIFWLPT